MCTGGASLGRVTDAGAQRRVPWVRVDDGQQPRRAAHKGAHRPADTVKDGKAAADAVGGRATTAHAWSVVHNVTRREVSASRARPRERRNASARACGQRFRKKRTPRTHARPEFRENWTACAASSAAAAAAVTTRAPALRAQTGGGGGGGGGAGARARSTHAAAAGQARNQLARAAEPSRRRALRIIATAAPRLQPPRPQPPDRSPPTATPRPRTLGIHPGTTPAAASPLLPAEIHRARTAHIPQHALRRATRL